ncbi:MAG: hypothetical protein HN380_06580 [Victivallales bacterium]|nr:hypothetical protein [Victivallales bacterium]
MVNTPSRAANLACILSLGLCLVGRAQPTRIVPVSRLEPPPIIDGRLDDAAWQTVGALALRNIKKGELRNGTTVRIGFDNSHFYVAILCKEAEMQHLRTAWTHAEERDSRIWQDDCVEVFLDPLSRSAGTGAHIVVNSAAVIYDAWDGDSNWDCDLRVAAVKQETAWSVEMAIAFESLGFQPVGGERWLLNVGREQKPRKELSCLGQGGGNFGSPERYVSAHFAGGGPVQLRTASVGGADLLALRLVQPATGTGSYRVGVRSLRGGAALSEKVETVKLVAGETRDLSVPYLSQPGEQHLAVTVADSATGKAVYKNTILIRRPSAKQKLRVWQLADPLYTELLSDEPTGLARDGAMYWFPEIDHGKFWLFASQYGQRYVKAEKYQMLADHLLHPLNNSYVLTTPAYDAFENYRRHGVKSILYPKPFGIKKSKDVPVLFPLGPEVRKAYLENVRTTLAEYGDVVWAVTFGDEVIDHAESAGITLLADHADAYPFIKQVDAEVKAQYGGGTYGMPQATSDSNACRWIAYRRWLTANLNEMLRELATVVRRTSPGTIVISDDPVAFHHALDYGGMHGHADLVTHQLYPRRDPNYPYFGYLTKTIADLSGIDEIWPCPHVEEYGTSYRPEEVLEQLSQVVRNGGTGYHLYLADTVGKRKGTKCLMNEYHGARDRWQVITAVLAELRKTRKLRFPQPDCAILYASDSVAAMPGRTVSEKLPCQYTFLGPVARSWFSFVDEFRIERSPDALQPFRAVYLPDGMYMRKSTAQALRAYVQGGGVLVVTDPNAFSHYSDGSSAVALRQELCGVNRGGTVRRRHLVFEGTQLPLVGAAYTVEIRPGAEVHARFDDGAPAIVQNSVGKGTCWYFASSPCARKALAKTGWQTFFRSFQKRIGVATGRDIWRFRFPAKFIQEPALPEGKCVTRNHIAWRQFKPITACNAPTGGSYSYSPGPDSIRDQGGTTDIPFDKGDLTDRRAAPKAGDVISKKSKIQDWVVRYKAPDPFRITFRLDAPGNLERVHLFYSGAMAGLAVEVSADGRTWQTVGTRGEANTAKQDVAEIRFDFEPVQAQYARLSFAKRPKRAHLMLSEVELWQR